jgi:glycine C-acetyltransferase
VMLASNNYLGLSNHPRIKQAAHRAIDEWGYGLASVRFLCGTEPIHFELERRIAKFVGCESAILHSSCFAANEAFFAALIANDFGGADYQDVIYSDQLNHASIIDGVRLCRAIAKQTVSRLYRNGDIKQLREMLEEDREKNYRVKIIATDGVFSMEGLLAPLPELVRLAREHGALLFVDESHATGVLGETGRGTPEELDVHGEIDVITGTFGKALGGASGGFIAGRSPLVEFIRQKSRPYTFSNTMPPPVVAGSIEAIDLIENDPSIVTRLHENTQYFRREIVRLGFKIIEGRHPIVPVMLGEAAVAQDMSRELLDEGVYIKGLWYPVVPKGEARLRAQISAAHTHLDLDRALEAFNKVGKRQGVI